MRSPPIQFQNRKTECWSYPKMSAYEDAFENRPDYFEFLNAPARNDHPIRIYIHIPYCSQFCSFCPYYKNIYGRSTDSARLEFLEFYAREMSFFAAKPAIRDRRVATIYFGGGDPAVLSIKEQRVLWRALRENFDIDAGIDVTMEGTATSLLDQEKLHFIKEQGVSRLSFGVQTFDETIRPQLNLEPTIQQIYSAAAAIRQAKIGSFSVDMIFNLPGQTDASLDRDIERFIELDPYYLDTYSLNLYPNTVYHKAAKSGKYGVPPDNEREIRMARRIQVALREAGYSAVSSVCFSKYETVPHLGFAHSLDGYPMLGIGPSSRSYVDGRNWRNFSSNARYAASLADGQPPVEAAALPSDFEEENWPFVFFPLRLHLDWSVVEASPRNKRIVEDMIDGGYAERQADRVILTETGRVWAGNLQRLFFSDAEREKEARSLFSALKNKDNPYNQDAMGVNQRTRSTTKANIVSQTAP
jgi:coproporphyrinogen III oxidase-like Fe-S oxidoreductase